jgi:prolipoprotein diacylglyceryltransferase
MGHFMILYGVERYFIEFLRDDPGRGEVFGGLMTGTQLISILLVIGGGLIWWLKSGVAASRSTGPERGTASKILLHSA